MSQFSDIKFETPSSSTELQHVILVKFRNFVVKYEVMDVVRVLQSLTTHKENYVPNAIDLFNLELFRISRTSNDVN